MALHGNPLTPLQPESPSDYERKRLELGRLIDEGDASGIVEGDIFEIIDAKYNLGLDDPDLDDE